MPGIRQRSMSMTSTSTYPVMARRSGGLYKPAATTSVVTMYVSDSFNRADSATTMGDTDSAYGGTTATWTPQVGTWGISSNQAYSPSAPSHGTTTVSSGVADCTVECKMASFGQGGPVWRLTDNNNFWVATSGSVYKRIAGSFTQVATYASETNGDILAATLLGSAGTLKKNGTTVATWSDSALASATKHGFWNNVTAGIRYDDFKVSP